MGGVKKRGQITVFIILGIVILMSSAIYFYFQKTTTTTQPEKVIDRKTTELHPYVETCVDMLTRDALDKVGVTGGYITYPFVINNNPSSYLDIVPKRMGSDRPRMPYWKFNNEIRIPPLDFIQNQIETYVKDNIDFCLDNFSAIKGYEVNKTGDIDVQIEFTAKDTFVKMKYPLKAVKVPQMNEFSLNDYDFQVRVPIRFRKVYDTAVKIMDDENKDYFMESFTMDLISLADTPGSPYMTPLMNMDFRLRPYIWKMKETTNNVKTLLVANTQYIKFEGTDYVPIDENYYNPEYPVGLNYTKNHFLWVFDNPENKYPGIHANVVYNEKWPFRIDISKTTGGVLRSGSTRISKYLSFIGIQTWHFTYDIVYPAVINIRDASGKYNDEYTFSFAFQVSIENNKPRPANFGSSIFDLDEKPTDEEQCAYLMSMNDKPVTFSTVDEFTGKSARRVNISVTCGRYTCPIGETVSDENNKGAIWSITSYAPYCSNAIVTATRPGYEEKNIRMNIDSDTGIVEIKLKPVVEYPQYEVVKRRYIVQKNPNENHVSENELPLDTNEKAVVVLTDEFGKEQYISYPRDKMNETDELTGNITEVEIPNPVKLYKYKETSYNVTIYFFNEEKDTILGGYKGVLSITDTGMVNQNNFIKFTVLQYSTNNEEELALFLSNIETYSANVSAPILLKKGN